MKRVLLLTALLIGCLFNIGCIGCTNISPGHAGIEVSKCSGGGVSETPLSIGYHFYGLCTDIIEMPTFQQTLVLTKAATEGSTSDDSITLTSSEGLPINVDVSMSFTVLEAKAPSIYKKFRMDIEHIEHTYMRQTVREALQESFAKYTAQQLYSDMKEKVRSEAQGLVVKKFEPDGFNVTQFTINEMRVPSEVLNAIKQKVAMTQEAQRAEQEVKKREFEAQQAVAVAKGEADARRMRVDAEAYANERLAKSLSPALVEYMKAQRWDGKMPQVTGSGGNILNLK